MNNTVSSNTTVFIMDPISERIKGKPAAYAVLFPFFVQVIGVVVGFLLTRFNIPILFAACMFLIGAIMGIGAVLSESDDQLTISILQWTTINAQVALLVFLPGIIFRDAIQVNFNLFIVALGQILIVAFPMALMGTALTAMVAVFVLPYNWIWSLGATLGAILSSTDLVAVSSVLKQAGVPPRLHMHLSGESMFNDGAALALFSICQKVFLYDTFGVGESTTVQESIVWFLKMAFGGVAVGFAFALALLFVLAELDRRLEPEYNVWQVSIAVAMAYLSYYVADSVLGMSGILSVLVCGITSQALGNGLINDPHAMSSYLSLMEHFLNTLMFALGGSVWGSILAGNNNHKLSASDWGWLFLLYLFVLLIRFVQVATFYPLLSRIGLKTNLRESAFIAFCGLRGSVGTALAVSFTRSITSVNTLSDTKNDTFLVEFMAGGIALLTLSLNGTLAGPVLKCLGLAKPMLSRKWALELFESSAEVHLVEELKQLLRQKRFRTVNVALIKAHVPYVKDWRKAFEVFDQDQEVSDEHFECLREVSEDECSEVAMRQLFLDLLNEAYDRILAVGDLDFKDERFYTFEALKQSVALATNDVNEKKSLRDFQYTEMYPFVEEFASTFRRKLRQITGKSKVLRASVGVANRNYKQLEGRVLRAQIFIRAHSIAEENLQSCITRYLDSRPPDSPMSSSVLDAVQVVVQESQSQVRAARKFIADIPQADVDSILSHFVATILLRKLADFVERGAMDRVLTKMEALRYLQQIEQRLDDARMCGAPCRRVRQFYRHVSIHEAVSPPSSMMLPALIEDEESQEE